MNRLPEFELSCYLDSLCDSIKELRKKIVQLLRDGECTEAYFLAIELTGDAEDLEHSLQIHDRVSRFAYRKGL